MSTIRIRALACGETVTGEAAFDDPRTRRLPVRQS